MKILTLIENLVYKQGLIAEHGLSFYIETDTKKILFDTGQSGIFLQNAEKLGIDIADIDALILSHGHYDHTGGLYPFLEKNSKATVYAKKEIFAPKYHGHSRFIGTLKKEALLGSRIVYVDVITEIDENVFIMPNITIYNSTDTHFEGLNIKQGTDFITDQFNDELFIVLKQQEQLNIVTACSHRGITNICNTATDYFKLSVNNILGGFHMKDCSIGQYMDIINYFRKLKPNAIGVCHCTGVEKYAHMRHDCALDIFYNFTGNVVEFP